MTRFISSLFAALLSVLPLSAALAQTGSPDEVVWVQIEAQPSLSQATARAQAYGAALEDVNGFSIGGGWYGIAVGPYRRADAEQVLRAYIRDRLVPRDSFIQLSSAFRQQFWPVGANVLELGVADAPVETEITTTPIQQTELPAPTEAAPTETVAAQEPAPQPVTEAAPVIQPADETRAQAQRSERDLSADARKDLQIALQWAGYYDAAIDGAFGRGTRSSMAAWQEANNFEPTGILTTMQRAVLLGQYNAVLDGLGLQVVRNEEAGIEMVMPTAEVGFSRFEAPFAHYDSTGPIGARLLLISQAGDQNTLFGLYDIMQTLEIVPVDGPRSRKNNSFELIGQNAQIISETQVSLQDGHVKGFTLVWPAGDEDRRTRVMAALRDSFTRLPAVLDPAAGSNVEQAIDLVSGLQVRQPKLSRSGFFIDGAGTVLTTAEVAESCSRLTLDGDTEAEVLTQDAGNGMAILKPSSPLAPLAVAAFNLTPPRLQSEISVAGYSYEGVLSAATLTFGTLADIRGLQGEENLNRLSLRAQPGDAGGPVFDASGNVMGMLITPPAGGQQLPEDVSFALDGASIAAIAGQAGVQLTAADRTGTAAPRDLRLAAQGMTVLVSCWE